MNVYTYIICTFWYIYIYISFDSTIGSKQVESWNSIYFFYPSNPASGDVTVGEVRKSGGDTRTLTTLRRDKIHGKISNLIPPMGINQLWIAFHNFKTRWWFLKYFSGVFVPKILGNDPIWQAYFSDGLKAPTSIPPWASINRHILRWWGTLFGVQLYPKRIGHLGSMKPGTDPEGLEVH